LASARELATQQAINDVYNELNSIFITPTTDLSRMRQPLVFWAHDDTTEPRKTYRYRIRLGVFNPIVERDQSFDKLRMVSKVEPQDKGTRLGGGRAEAGQTNIILWSEFSSPTQPIEIPGVVYFFAKGIQEAAKKVTVQVSKYMMGYWHSEDFLVGQGETIGKVVEPQWDTPRGILSKPVEAKPGFDSLRPAFGEVSPRGGRGEPVTVVQPRPPSVLPGGRRGERLVEGRTPLDTTPPVPEMPMTIDYSTGAVLVDVVLVNDWSSGSGKNMFARYYYDMLYSFDGVNIERTPVDIKYWTAELRAAYVEIVNSQKEPREPLRPFGTQSTDFRNISPTLLYRDKGYDARATE
jgi:hypothetical protein